MKDICKSKMFSLLKRVAFAPTEKDKNRRKKTVRARLGSFSLSLYFRRALTLFYICGEEKESARCFSFLVASKPERKTCENPKQKMNFLLIAKRVI